MQKTLMFMLFGAVLFLSAMLFLEKADDVVNGPDVNGGRRGLLNRVMHAIGSWAIDKSFKDDAPQNDPSLAIQSSVPPHPLHELLITDSESLKHGEGW